MRLYARIYMRVRVGRYELKNILIETPPPPPSVIDNTKSNVIRAIQGRRGFRAERGGFFVLDRVTELKRTHRHHFYKENIRVNGNLLIHEYTTCYIHVQYKCLRFCIFYFYFTSSEQTDGFRPTRLITKETDLSFLSENRSQ